MLLYSMKRKAFEFCLRKLSAQRKDDNLGKRIKETSKEGRLRRIRNKLGEMIIKAKKGENSD